MKKSLLENKMLNILKELEVNQDIKDNQYEVGNIFEKNNSISIQIFKINFF